MDKVIKLTKIFLKNSFSNMDARMGVSTKSKSKILIYGILFLYFAGLIIFLGYNLLDGLIAIHQETVFVGMILFMIFGLAIIQTIFIGKEFKNMARNPVFLMQCLIPAILIPIIMVVVVYAGLNSDGMGLEQITQWEYYKV